MSQRIVSPPSGPIKRGLYGLISSFVKPSGLRIAHGEPIHFSNSAAVHPRRPICFEAFQKLHYCNSILFGLAIAALLCATPSTWAAGQTTRVSVASDRTQGNFGGGFAYGNVISADGRFVAFASNSDNLVSGDTNGQGDIFVHDRLTGDTARISLALDNNQGNHASYYPSAISADGRYVAFNSDADNLVPGDTNDIPDTFVYDRKRDKTNRVTLASDGSQGSGGLHGDFTTMSADGRYVVFNSEASNLVSGDTNGIGDTFVHDLRTNQTTRVNQTSNGSQADPSPTTNASDFPLAISTDGRYVAFTSASANLVPGDTNGFLDVFIRDRKANKTTRVNLASDGTQGNSTSYVTGLSSDGRFVVFVSSANNLVSGDTNGVDDVFVRDRYSGQTTRVSVTKDGIQGNGSSMLYPAISADGRYVVFASTADNLVQGDTNESTDVFVRDLLSSQTTRVNVTSYNMQSSSGDNSSISADGRFVAFNSGADNLIPADTNYISDVFVRDRLLLPNKKADLSVTQSESGDPVVKGRKLTYTVKVKNNGRDPASDVNLTDLVPLEAQLLSVIPSQGSCYKAPITVCRLGKLSSGASAKVRIKLKARRSGVIRNTVSVNAAPKDLAPYNNSSTISTLIK